MDGANQRFMNRKAAWLADHLILYAVDKGTTNKNPYNQGLGTVGTELPTYDFDLRKVGKIINSGGGDAKMYELQGLNEGIGTGRNFKARKTSGSTHAITAYFVPWGTNMTFCGRLGTAADYFFTPTVNGCTFAHSGNGPNPSVAHSNFVDDTTQLIDQNAIDADLTTKFGGVLPARTLIKTTYKQPPVANVADDYRATVIGIRTGNTWRFYYQNYSILLVTGALRYSGVNLCVQI